MRQFQNSNATSINRYPNVLHTLSNIFEADEDLRILVFGGSIGLEALTMTRRFPKARVVSLEINKTSHATAKRIAEIDPRVVPRVSSLADLRKMSAFDIILVHSALCDHPGGLRKPVFDAFSFNDFETILDALLSRLRPDGVISLVNTSYCFEDSSLSQGFSKVGTQFEGMIPKFAPDGTKIAQLYLHNGWIFAQRNPSVPRQHVLDRLSGSMFTMGSRRFTPPSTLFSLAASEMPDVGRPPAQIMVENYVDMETRLELYNASAVALGFRFAFGPSALTD